MKVGRFFLFLFCVNASFGVFAQLSDKQVQYMLQEAVRQGLGKEEIGLMFMEKGVTQEQVLRIINGSESGGDSSNIGMFQNRNREGNGQTYGKKTNHKGKKYPIFGHDVFNNEWLTFEPNFNIATPKNYILGPGDEIIVDIWGDAEQTFRQKISPEGMIVDAKIGPVYLNGLSVEEATNRLKNAFARIYATMQGKQPTTFISLSLGKIRSIRVNVMGEVETPGSYTLPSLASLFHAIYCAGGVNNIGSLRTIQISRGGKKFAVIDIYDYLLNGETDLNIRLEDGDVVIVKPYQNLITLKGKVKRPLIYELKDGEPMTQLLYYAGGFTGEAYTKVIRVIRKSGREYQIYNIDDMEFDQFVLTDGDEVTVDSVIERFGNRVEIRGAVYRTGLYDLGEIATVKQLIERAEGVKGDAFLNRAVLYREKANLTQEILAIDVKGILNGSIPDVCLQNNDVLYIPSIFDLQESYTVKITGAVGTPGEYPFADGMSIEDLIIRAGGLKESASVVKIDVARRIKDANSTTTKQGIAENYVLTLKDGFVVDGLQNFVLQPFDEVFVRKSPGYQEQQRIRILGEVLFEGEYVLSKKGERLSDLVKKAGGLTPEAYVAGACLHRKMNEDERNRVRSVLQLTKRNDIDTIALNQLELTNEYAVGIDLEKALKYPGSEFDVVVREGDVLRVPEYSSIVKISGAVMYANSVVYNGNANLKYYIGQGGGFANRAKKGKVFVVYMNGQVARNRLFKKAKVAPGCEIIVPQKSVRKNVGLAEVLGIATSTTSIAALISTIMNNTK